MKEIKSSDANQSHNIDFLLYNNITSKVFNGFSSLICEAEQAFYDTGNVEIIIGYNKTIYRIPYKGKMFEFEHNELLTADIFNKKCLASGFNIVNFGTNGWRGYINEIQKKAIIVDETEYKPYVTIAKDYCHFILTGGINDKSDSLEDDLIGNEKTCYKSVETEKKI